MLLFMEDDIMKKRFALLRRKLKSVREEKLPGRAVIFSVAAGLPYRCFLHRNDIYKTGIICTGRNAEASGARSVSLSCVSE